MTAEGPKKRRHPPLRLDVEFGEALGRFIQTDPAELGGNAASPRVPPTGSERPAKENAATMASAPDRIRESDLVMPTLRLAAARPSGFISTSDLIRELTELFQPAGADAEILAERSDTYFSQKIRNLISHKKGVNSFVANGYAEHDEEREGIQITDAGRKLLKMLGG